MWGDAANPMIGHEANDRAIRTSVVKASAHAVNKTGSGKTLQKPAARPPSEAEKARSLALGLAKADTAVTKIKVCHDKKKGEWWLTLYEDEGYYFRVRRYIWSIQRDRPEEYLVLKRISKSKLESDLTASEPGSVCHVIKYDPDNRLSALLTSEFPHQDSDSKKTLGSTSSPISLSDTKNTRVRKTETSNPANQLRQEVPICFVFVYGSEMNHQKLLEWLKANHYDSSVVRDAEPGILDNYDLVWDYYSLSRGGGTANLEPKKNSKVWGLLVKIEDRGLTAFDRKEGHPRYYNRGDDRVAVKRVSDGKTVFAWLYRAKPNRAGAKNVWPTKDYKRTMIEAANFWQFPSRYIKKLENLPTR
jgi:gamma-glutamylcyclotransferase (GGCT)/AIG2-like uncharacterized protein YtfP